jgi:toxin HigB-1
VIQTFADSETERLYVQGNSRHLPTEIRKRAAMRLIQLNAATQVDDLRLPPSNRLEQLRGDRAGEWSVRINDQWRICFRFHDGDAFDVEIVDYHWGEITMAKRGLPAVHPGEFLAETLEELGLSPAAFARVIGVSPLRISHVTKGLRPVTAELALRFGRAFRQTPQYWLNLQADYDLKTATATIGPRLIAIHSIAER